MELGWKQGFRVSAREPVLPLGVETVEDVGKGSHESELEPHVGRARGRRVDMALLVG